MVKWAVLASGSQTTIDFVNDNVVSELGSLVTTILGWVTSNQLLMVFITFSMISIGFALIRKLKGVIRIH